MFENNCTECWDWTVDFLQQIFIDTSLEGLSKSLVVLVTIVIISYGIFSILSYVGNIGANLVRKAVLPVAFITLLLLSLTVLAQYRKDKICKFPAERYLTECIPEESTGDSSPDDEEPPSKISKVSKTKPKNTWETATSTPAVNSWNSVSTPPKTKSSTTKPLKTQSTASRAAKKNCEPSQKSKNTTSSESECETPKSWEAGDVTKPKERDYSKD